MRFKLITFFVIAFFNFFGLDAQNNFKAIVIDEANSEALVGLNAIIENTNTGGTTDANGVVEIKNIPDGEHCIVFTFVGYERTKICLTFPLKNPDEIISIRIKPKGKELRSEERRVGKEG